MARPFSSDKIISLAGTSMDGEQRKSSADSTSTSSSSRMPDGDVPPSPVDSFKSAGRYFAEFQSYLGHYLAAKSDQLKVSIRKLLMLVVLGLVGLVVGGAMLATAGILVLVGLANPI